MEWNWFGTGFFFSLSFLEFFAVCFAINYDIDGLLVNDSKDERKDYKEATYSASCSAKESKPLVPPPSGSTLGNDIIPPTWYYMRQDNSLAY